MPLPHRRLMTLFAIVTLLSVPALYADHAWNNYHWARTANPFTLKVHDNVTSIWEPHLAEADTDWDASSVLDLNVLWDQPLSNVRRCTSATGRIEVCNARYGNTGWLGVAGIWVSGDHITKGYTKVNDTYFDTATYNTPAWRQFVMCQEIGHDFGLAHQDETFDNANLGSCMDYTNDPDGSVKNQANNTKPNAHDYDQLETIYAHLDSTTTITSIIEVTARSLGRTKTLEEILFDADQWGTPVRFNREGMPIVFFMATSANDKGQLEGWLTYVIWAPEDPFHRGDGDRPDPTR